MRILKFIVDGQIIEKSPMCDFSNIFPGTYGMLEVEFLFSSEWNGMVKVVEFTSGPIEKADFIDENNKAKIPKEILERPSYNIRVLGKDIDTNRTIKTVKYLVRQGGTE